MVPPAQIRLPPQTGKCLPSRRGQSSMRQGKGSGGVSNIEGTVSSRCVRTWGGGQFRWPFSGRGTPPPRQPILWCLGFGHRRTVAGEPGSNSLSWPFREPPGLWCRKGKGPKLGEGGAGRGELCGQGAAEHSCALPERPIAGSRPFGPRPRWSPQWSCSCSSWLNKQVRVWLWAHGLGLG